MNIVPDIIAAATSAVSVKTLADGSEVIIVPEGYDLSKGEDFNLKPRLVKQTVSHRTLESFMRYMNTHKTAASVIFADVDRTFILGVVDYHSADNKPERTQHRAAYDVPHSEEWKRWTGIDGKMLPQALFARFIEENQIDIVQPSGADVFEIALSLQAKKNVNFRSGVVLQNGDVDLEYTEETEAKAGVKGKLTIPKEIVIGIPVFFRGTAYRVSCRFRYEINEGNLRVGIEIARKKELVDSAFNDILDRIRGKGPAGDKPAILAGVEDVVLYEGSIGEKPDAAP